MPNVGIIDVINNLPIGLLQPRLDGNGPYGPGNHSLTTWSDGGVTKNVDNTFGVVVQISGSIAPYVGVTYGFDDGGEVVTDVYEQRITQLVTLHQMFGGNWVATSVVDVFVAPYLIRWVEALPGKIGLYVGPTWHVDLYYLLAL